jgi:RNA polymerase sigma factor (sigma-70 family)
MQLLDSRLDPFEEWEAKELIHKAIKSIPDKNVRNAVVLRYLHGKIYKDIGMDMGVSRSRAQQLVYKGLRQLRHPIRVRMLWDYLR